MRILMLGNSFTFFNDMPKVLAVLLSADVEVHSRGGSYLSEQLNPDTELGAQTIHSLLEEKWDYVILQEQSRGPITHPGSFCNSVQLLSKLARQAGAEPVLFATWAYRENSERLAETGLTYDQMDHALYEGYHAAAEANDLLVADVGKAFSAVRDIVSLYAADDYHPSAAGSMLAAHVIAKVIEKDLSCN